MLIRKGRHGPNRRAGTVLVELAIIYPVLFIILFGLVMGGIGVFRYHQVSYLAREGSRYASVHGSVYEQEHNIVGKTDADRKNDIYNEAIKPRAIRMQLDVQDCTVTWNTNNQPYHTTITNGQVVPVANTVSVTVKYKWNPGFIFKPVTLSSTSVSTMSY
jgi:Flp pilus assembly protein TadG